MLVRRWLQVQSAPTGRWIRKNLAARNCGTDQVRKTLANLGTRNAVWLAFLNRFLTR